MGEKTLECAAVLFDLDGVLIDSSACIMRHWKAWAEQHDLDLSQIMQVAHGMRTIDTMRQVQEHGAQLNMFLGQQLGSGAHWVAQPKSAQDE